jgi:hypothetical protein
MSGMGERRQHKDRGEDGDVKKDEMTETSTGMETRTG